MMCFLLVFWAVFYVIVSVCLVCIVLFVLLCSAIGFIYFLIPKLFLLWEKLIKES